MTKYENESDLLRPFPRLQQHKPTQRYHPRAHRKCAMQDHKRYMHNGHSAMHMCGRIHRTYNWTHMSHAGLMCAHERRFVAAAGGEAKKWPVSNVRN